MRNRGLLRLLALGGMTVLAACTAKPAPPLKVTPPAATTQAVSPTIEMKLYGEEAPALAAYAGYARRQDGKLVISYDGRDVVRLTSSPATDCEGWETCSLWRFAGVIGLVDRGVVRPFAVVERDHGEGTQEIIIDHKGSLVWASGKLLASDDGRFLAAGETGNALNSGYLQIIEWPYPRTTYESFSPCAPKTWTAATVLQLECGNSDELLPYFSATATRQGNERWQVTADNPADAGRLKPATMKTTSAREVRDLAAWEAKKGVEHLN